MKTYAVKMVVICFCIAGLGFGFNYLQQQEKHKKEESHNIGVSPIRQKFIERNGKKLFRVTYGEVVLEIPRRYKASMDKKIKSVAFFLFGSDLQTLEKDIEGHSARVFIQPHENRDNWSDKAKDRRIDWFVNNGFVYRESEEYPPLMEYWDPKQARSYYFTTQYKPIIFRDTISCNPGYRERLIEKERSKIRLGDTSCKIFGAISDNISVRVSFDARLLIDGEKFHRNIDQLITSFIVNR